MSIKSGVAVTRDTVRQMMDNIKSLTKQDILVGIPGEGNTRDDGANNATIGYLMETGEPAMNLPARPFLVPGVEAGQDKITDRFEKAANAAIDGRSEEVEKHLIAAGLQAVSSVKGTIVNGEFEPLSERTLADRRRRGKKSDKPLIDTSQMMKSVTYIKRKKGQK